MTRTFTRIVLLACFSIAIACPGSGASASESECTIQIPQDRLIEFLSPMHWNPAFANGQAVGFRIYEKKSNPGALSPLGLHSGDLLTHFCGIRVNMGLLADATICCTAKDAAPDRVELTVERDGKVIRVMAPMPHA